MNGKQISIIFIILLTFAGLLFFKGQGPPANPLANNVADTPVTLYTAAEQYNYALENGRGMWLFFESDA